MSSSLATATGRILARSSVLSSSAPSSCAAACPSSATAASRTAATNATAGGCGRRKHRPNVEASSAAALFSSASSLPIGSAATCAETNATAALVSGRAGTGVGRGMARAEDGGASSRPSLSSSACLRGLAGSGPLASTLSLAMRSSSSAATGVLDNGAGVAAAADWTTAEFVTATLLAISAAGIFVAGKTATTANEGVRFVGPPPSFAGVQAKLGGGGEGGGGGGGGRSAPDGAAASLTTLQGTGEAVNDKPKDENFGIEFDIAGRKVRLLGNAAVASEWIGTGAPKMNAKIEPHSPHEAYDVSIRALKGGRLSMEDEYFVANGGRFVAIFDGHGGGGVSQYLRDKLYEVFGRHLREVEERSTEKTYPYSLVAPNTDLRAQVSASAMSPRSCSITSRVAAMRAAFEEIDRDVCLDDDLQYQGSTAVAVVLHEEPDGTRTLVSANVGDSRAVLSRRGRAVDLTRDHKPNDEKEKARILAMGETIEWDHYCKVHRVRNLSLSRAIGDRFAKPAVSGEVEIKRFPIAEDGDEFIMLASDGLWDVMSSQEAVSFVHKKLGSGLPNNTEEVERIVYTRRKNMSRFLANEALRRGSGDNVSVVIVWLKDSHFEPKRK